MCYIKVMINILITAGGTSEQIDDVRRITNSGTGRLGAKIADAFAESIDCAITYICSENAARPDSDATVRVCESVADVKEAIGLACAGTEYDVIVHSMAIGDYQVRAVSDSAQMTTSVIERLSVLACGDSSSPEEAVRVALLSPPGIRENKISSDKEDLIVVLEKAPKIIALLRGLAPQAVIVGFKLLSGVSDEELVSAGLALLQKNDCDLVLANDMNTVMGDRHEGLLIARDGTYERAIGKDDIAKLVCGRAAALL